MKYLKRFVFILIFLVAVGLFLDMLASRELPVLMYHFVGTKSQAQENQLIISEETLKHHIALLKSWGYHVYSLDDIYDFETGKKPFSDRGVVLTFDDGNRDFYERVFPILGKEKVPAAVFLIWRNVSRQEQGSMSLSQVRALTNSPWVTLGVHTVNHKELIDLPADVMRQEIVDGKRFFESALGRPLFYFSYPSGYFNEQSMAMVRHAGFRLAFTTSWKRLGCRDENLFCLTRVKITENEASFLRFWFKASGWYSLCERIKHSLTLFISTFR